MISKEDVNKKFEVQKSYGFISINIEELCLGDIIRIRRNGKLEERKTVYQAGHLNYNFKRYVVICTPYQGVDKIWRVGIREYK